MDKPADQMLATLRERAAEETQQLQKAFFRTGDGTAVVRQRSAAVQAVLVQLWADLTQTHLPVAVSLFALGGFGREELFPFSDIDLLVLCANESAEREARDLIRTFVRAVWDIGWRAAPTTRTLKECERLDGETNLEFAISLLDRRFLTGDAALAARFESEALLPALLRELPALEKHLNDAARARHGRYGDTIFHLEPNLKEGPGGLRDVHLIHWRERMRELGATKTWPVGGEPGESAAFEFLAAARCFLHFRDGRDNNLLDWAAQDEAAAQSIGLETLGSVDPAYWMRTFYRHARAIDRRAELLLDLPAPKPLLRSLRRRRVVIPGTKFFVEHNRIGCDPAPLAGDDEGSALLRLFAYVAQNGSRLLEETETRIADSLPALAVHMPEGPFLWNGLRDILLGTQAAHALRLMHTLGLLELILPEFHGIDSLVVRDAYHRYTVDEHTFLVIEHVHALRTPRHEWERRFSTLLPEIERLDLLMLAILLHDTGKARRTGDHARESIELAERVFARLEFDLEERETVRRLIRSHLEMSFALRRDIFDPETVRGFSEHAPGPQQLRMLTLLTFADIKAVHPDALTPWKAENLWQLYIATAGYLDRSVDETRYHVDADPVSLARILSRVAVHGGFAEGEEDAQGRQLRQFLEGMPRRYLQTRLPDQISEHFQLALALGDDPVQLQFRRHRQCNEITLVTRDRPMLFADMAGALSAWGMNIIKADAFSNAAGIILDTFQFTDPFRTLELNPGEHARFEASLRAVLKNEVTVESMLKARQHPRRSSPLRTGTLPHFHFDRESSSHSTLLQVVAPDSPGLLRSMAATIAACGCSITIALVDTEGELAIDVFYLTANGRKLSRGEEECIAERLSAGFQATPLTATPGTSVAAKPLS